MLLERSTWPEVEAHLARSTGFVLPLGSVEQHGPTAPIGTDALCAQAVARGVGERTGALVGPTVWYGVAPFNLGFPGTVSLAPATLTAWLVDCVDALARHGVTHVYCVNGHGGNVAPARAAFAELYQRAGVARDAHGRAPPRCRLVSWWQYPRTDALRTRLYGAAEGMHATPSEVSIARHVRPETARDARLEAPAPLDERFVRDHAGDAHFDAVHHRARFPDGRVGSDPTLASEADGASLLALAVEEASEDYLAFLAEP